MNYQTAMTTALENTYILLAMMDQVGREEGIENRLKIAPAMARAEEHLEALWKGKEVQFPDFEDVMGVASAAAIQIWNPLHKDFLHRHAVLAVNDKARAENWHRVEIERTPYISTEDIRSIQEDVMGEAERVVASQDLTSRSAASILAGAEAIREMSQLRAEARHSTEEGINYDKIRLPVMNLDGAYGPVFNAWVHGLAVTRTLPQPDTLQPLLHEAKTKGEVTSDLRSAVANSWIAERPELPSEWVHEATEVLAEASVSEQITNSEDPVEHVAQRLAKAASFQSLFAEGYSDLAETYSVSSRLSQAIEQYSEMNERAHAALSEIEATIEAGESLASLEGIGPMNQSDQDKLRQLEQLKGQLALRVAELPDQLEELAQRIRAANPDEDQGPRLAMG